MNFTGERMIPEFNKKDEIYDEHMNRYFFASQFAKDKVILDIACGSGYGCSLLSEAGAKKVVGVDISQEAIDYCQKKYSGIEFLQGGVEKIPLDDKSVDVVVSFETIEHVNEQSQKKFMEEIKRILKNDGLLIISTPNSLVYPKGNEFHIKELSVDEFKMIVSDKFRNVNLYYQDEITVDYLFSEKTLGSEILLKNDIKINSKKTGKVDALDSMYLIALCSDGELSKCIEENLMISDQKPRKIFKKMHDDYEGHIESLLVDIKKRDFEINYQRQKIESMEASRFWKIRESYLNFKDKLKK